MRTSPSQWAPVLGNTSVVGLDAPHARRVSMPSRTRSLRRLGALTALAGALFSPDASAQTMTAGGGVFVGLAFGEEPEIHFGAELFGHRVIPEISYNCGQAIHPRERTAIGPLFQVASVGFRPPRLTLAMHAARELSFDGTSLGAELGLSYRFGDQPGFGVHTGLGGGRANFNGALRAQWLLDEYTLTAGLRAPGVFTPLSSSSCWVPGRPLRDDLGRVEVVERCRVVDDGGPPQRGRPSELASAWERDAQYECASIPAFLELAENLLACGAPAALVDRALDAACDEIQHAWLCAEMARRSAGVSFRPALPAPPSRVLTTGLDSLLRLATESWTDGCLGEGQAALVAEAGAAAARDEDVRLAQTTIARDERRHANLAWDILAWALARGGEPVRAALLAQRDTLPELPSSSLAPSGFSPWGRIDADHMAAILEKHLAESQRRLNSLLRA